MSSYPLFDIKIWEQIRFRVEVKTDDLLREIGQEITCDRPLRDYQSVYPVPWQMGEIMRQRAESWIQRLYDLCCDAYKRIGKEVSEEFDRAVWAYWIEPFITREEETTADGCRASKLLELLLCAVGSPPENRKQLKVGQRQRCETVRNEIFSLWQKKLLRLAARPDEPTRLAPVAATQFTTAPTATEPSPEPLPLPTTVAPTGTPEPTLAAQPPTQPPPTDSLAPASKASEPEPTLPAQRYSGASKWQNIEITFLSDFRIQIRINGKQFESANYGDLGFEDGRSEKPDKAWVALRSLAKQGGVLREGSSLGEPWPKVEKRIQEIRKRLRELFGIPSDPIPFVEGVGYQAVLKIRCGASFRT